MDEKFALKECRRRDSLGWTGEWYSLPAEVLWGSFVTNSFLPTWGRNECVTNEPQRTSAGRLGMVLVQKARKSPLCLRLDKWMRRKWRLSVPFSTRPLMESPGRVLSLQSIADHIGGSGVCDVTKEYIASAVERKRPLNKSSYIRLLRTAIYWHVRRWLACSIGGYRRLPFLFLKSRITFYLQIY